MNTDPTGRVNFIRRGWVFALGFSPAEQRTIITVGVASVLWVANAVCSIFGITGYVCYLVAALLGRNIGEEVAKYKLPPGHALLEVLFSMLCASGWVERQRGDWQYRTWHPRSWVWLSGR